jgi:hypothetical protein
MGSGPGEVLILEASPGNGEGGRRSLHFIINNERLIKALEKWREPIRQVGQGIL